MRHSFFATARAPVRGLARTLRASCVAAATSLIVTACSVEGDLGRPKQTHFIDKVINTVHPRDGQYPGRGSSFDLTADEVQLRQAAYRLRVQPHNFMPIRGMPNAETAYSSHLRSADYVYGPSRLSQINQDILADHGALTTFGQAGRRVAAADRARAMALGGGSLHYTASDIRNTRRRMEENHGFIRGTFDDLDRRLTAYDAAIDRTRIETPAVSPMVVRNTLDHLRERATALRYELTQAYGIAPPGWSSHKPAKGASSSTAPMDIRPRRTKALGAEPSRRL